MESVNKLSILVAEDHPLMRKAIRVTLEVVPEFEIVGEAQDGEEAVNSTARLSPNLVIMDITLPKLNGIQAARQIKALNPNIAILALTVHDDIEHVCAMINAGASGYLTKDILEQDLVNAIRRVISGETILTTPIIQKVLKTLNDVKEPLLLESREKLSIRHLEILKLVAKGLRNQDIASHLNLSLLTIKAYMVEILSKLNATSRTEAVGIALRMGLLTINDIEK